MSLAIRLHALGGPEVLRAEEVRSADPGPGEVRLRQSAIGVNFVDVYHRTGLYPLPGLPATPGVEGVGVIDAVGPEVDGFAEGDRVVYAGMPAGAYATERVISAARLIRVPGGLDDRTACAMMLRGLTAHMLLFRLRAVGPGDTLLVHAAAGGLGLILGQWAMRLGARVIGTVGSPEKAALARRAGFEEIVIRRDGDFVAEVRALTNGDGVDYAIDGVGGETLIRTLDVVRPFGQVASLGQVEGAVRPIDVAEIGPVRSLSLARPSVFRYIADRPTYLSAAQALAAVVQNGLHVEVGATFGLDQAADAHRALEAGRTTGSVLLLA